MRPGRSRALILGVLAIVCAVASAGLTAGYRESAAQQLGEMRPVVVAIADLEADTELTRRVLRRRTEIREVPVRFAPPDTLAAPEVAIGAVPLGGVPAGSYLTDSRLAPAGGTPGRSRLAPGMRELRLRVSDGGGFSDQGRGRPLVDVVVAGEPNAGARARAEVVASGVRLLELVPLEQARSFDGVGPASEAWATLSVTPAQALELIEAENYAREVRLIPRG